MRTTILSFYLFSWTTLLLVGCKQHFFYIYENDEWPEIAGASIHKRDRNEKLDNQLHFGAGPIVNETLGEYHTDQYQLFSMIYYRALKDPRRTLDPAKATSFFIPYDFSLDSAYYKYCGKSTGVCYDFRKCPLVPKIEALLQSSYYFKRNHGLDHFVIIGMNYAMDHYIMKPKCKQFLSSICYNCTKFAIDDYSFMHAGDAGRDSRGDYWAAIPFPSDFHWTSQVATPFPWENTYRPILVSYIGSDKSFYGPSRRLRSSLIHYCHVHTEHCVYMSYGVNGTRYSYHLPNHQPLTIAKHSIFCFQPTGDLMTRKGLFDTLLQGCIPVIFDPLTSRVMYTWHWEETFWRDISIELPFHPIAHRYQDPIKELQSYMIHNRSWIAQKQALIRRYVFQLQYAITGYEEKYQYTSAISYVQLVMNSTTTTNTITNDSMMSVSHTNKEVPRSAHHVQYGQDTNVSSIQVVKEDETIVYEARTFRGHGQILSDNKLSHTKPGKSAAVMSGGESSKKSLRGAGETGGEAVLPVEGDGKAVVAEEEEVAVEWVSYATSSWPLDEDTRQPMLDAYEITMRYVLGWHSGEISRIRNATVPECWDGWLDVQANMCRPGKEPGK